MSRRFQEIEERSIGEIEGAKGVLKRLGQPQRARILAWLCTYYGDDGEMLASQSTKARTRIVLDDAEYWLVRVPKRTTTVLRKRTLDD